MTPSLRALCLSVLAAFCAAPTLNSQTNLVTDGTFTNVTLTSTGMAQANLYGQFGSGGKITVGGWSTSGYNFVYLPNTLESSSTAETGGTTGVYMWGPDNGGSSMNGTSPYPYPGAPAANGAAPNCIAADGAYQTAAITQQINGLVLGAIYQVNFSWAADQQTGFNGNTTEAWKVQLGTSTTLSTPTYALTSHNFSGWMTATTSTGGGFFFQANAATETLSFLAAGTPTGEPPFSLLSNVSLIAAPEPATWAWFIGGGAALTALAVVRRRRAGRLAA